jgi:hypothetical protein
MRICHLNRNTPIAGTESETEGPVQTSGNQADRGADADETHKFRVRIELEKIDQQKPLADLPDGDRGLDDPGQPDRGYGQAETVQYHFQNRHEGVRGHPEQQPLFAVAEPGNEAEDGCQSVE